jgi:hypothetical protein
VTIEKLRWLLAKMLAVFGARRVGELSPAENRGLADVDPAGTPVRGDAGAAPVLARAVVWRMLSVNSARLGVDNPQPPRKEQRPFESWAQLGALADGSALAMGRW